MRAVEDTRHILVEDQLSGHRCEVDVHLEELDDKEGFTPGRIPFRFGYAFTAWTAQGGEWPQVAISLPEARRHNGMCFYRNRLQEPA